MPDLRAVPVAMQCVPSRSRLFSERPFWMLTDTAVGTCDRGPNEHVFGETPNTACETHALPGSSRRFFNSTENVDEPKKRAARVSGSVKDQRIKLLFLAQTQEECRRSHNTKSNRARFGNNTGCQTNVPKLWHGRRKGGRRPGLGTAKSHIASSGKASRNTSGFRRSVTG
jgi:hypothetical protein